MDSKQTVGDRVGARFQPAVIVGDDVKSLSTNLNCLLAFIVLLRGWMLDVRCSPLFGFWDRSVNPPALLCSLLPPVKSILA
jgi:hypothetical protein